MFKNLSTSLVAFLIVLFAANQASAFNYDECMERARTIGDLEMAKCKHSQMLIELKELKQEYNDIAKDPKFTTIISQQDLKKMYNAWQIYRDLYCNSYAATIEAKNKEELKESGTVSDNPEYYREHCLQEFTNNSKQYIQVMHNAIQVESHGH